MNLIFRCLWFQNHGQSSFRIQSYSLNATTATGTKSKFFTHDVPVVNWHYALINYQLTFHNCTLKRYGTIQNLISYK